MCVCVCFVVDLNINQRAFEHPVKLTNKLIVNQFGYCERGLRKKELSGTTPDLNVVESFLGSVTSLVCFYAL